MFPSQFYNFIGYAFDAKHKTDLNPDNLKGGDDLDPEFVLSCRVRTGRSIRGRGLPPVCTRAERKDVESIVMDGLNKLEGDFSGMLSLFYYNIVVDVVVVDVEYKRSYKKRCLFSYFKLKI